MLNLFNTLRGLTGITLAAQASYKPLEASFPVAMAPITATPRLAPLCTISDVGPLGAQRVRPGRSRALLGACRALSLKKLLASSLRRGAKGLPLSLSRGAPLLALNHVGRAGPFPPKQNSLAV
jgi:hypothetical protein